MSTEQPEIIHPPVPPSIADPVNFDVRADAFLGWFPTAWSYLSALVDWLQSLVVDVAASKASAAQSAASCTAVANLPSVQNAQANAQSAQQSAMLAQQAALQAESVSRLSIGMVDTAPSGAVAQATITGQVGAQQLNLLLPRGEPGLGTAPRTWVDAAPFRGEFVTYTNTSGYEIEVCVFALGSPDTYVGIAIYDQYWGGIETLDAHVISAFVDEMRVSTGNVFTSFITGDQVVNPLRFTVPNGSTYRVEGACQSWLELRA